MAQPRRCPHASVRHRFRAVGSRPLTRPAPARWVKRPRPNYVEVARVYEIRGDSVRAQVQTVWGPDCLGNPGRFSVRARRHRVPDGIKGAVGVRGDHGAVDQELDLGDGAVRIAGAGARRGIGKEPAPAPMLASCDAESGRNSAAASTRIVIASRALLPTLVWRLPLHAQ